MHSILTILDFSPDAFSGLFKSNSYRSSSFRLYGCASRKNRNRQRVVDQPIRFVRSCARWASTHSHSRWSVDGGQHRHRRGYGRYSRDDCSSSNGGQTLRSQNLHRYHCSHRHVGPTHSSLNIARAVGRRSIQCISTSTTGYGYLCPKIRVCWRSVCGGYRPRRNSGGFVPSLYFDCFSNLPSKMPSIQREKAVDVRATITSLIPPIALFFRSSDQSLLV